MFYTASLNTLDGNVNSRSSYTNTVLDRIAFNIMGTYEIGALHMGAVFISACNLTSNTVSLKRDFTTVANFPIKFAITKLGHIGNIEV